MQLRAGQGAPGGSAAANLQLRGSHPGKSHVLTSLSMTFIDCSDKCTIVFLSHRMVTIAPMSWISRTPGRASAATRSSLVRLSCAMKTTG